MTQSTLKLEKIIFTIITTSIVTQYNYSYCSCVAFDLLTLVVVVVVAIVAGGVVVVWWVWTFPSHQTNAWWLLVFDKTTCMRFV